MKNLIPPQHLKLRYLGHISAVDHYQTGHVRISIGHQRESGLLRHQMSFVVQMKRLNLSYCHDLAEKIGPGLRWQLDDKYSRDKRCYRLWADVCDQENQVSSHHL